MEKYKKQSSFPSTYGRNSIRAHSATSTRGGDLFGGQDGEQRHDHQLGSSWQLPGAPAPDADGLCRTGPLHP